VGKYRNRETVTLHDCHRIGCGTSLQKELCVLPKNGRRSSESKPIYTLKGNTPRGHDHRSRWTEMFDTSTQTLEPLKPLECLEVVNYQVPDTRRKCLPMRQRVKVPWSLKTLWESAASTVNEHTSSNRGLNAATGWNLTPDESRIIGVRAVNLLRLLTFDVELLGILIFRLNATDSVPVDGPAKGIGIKPYWRDAKELLYLLGWDVEQENPSRQR